MPDAMPPDQPHDRRDWMAVLARARPAAIAGLLGTSGTLPEYQRLRGPESGLVMVRGRAGGGGAAFNLGEMTVTRCTVRTDGGFVGHAYVTGRDERQAELAALADALLQDPARRSRLLATLIEPLVAEQHAAREATAAKAAATRVQFFAMRNMRT
jgi:alpha-D-ribose 1-methylphosphonate 5-triphosphate synthase subunit PhnG